MPDDNKQATQIVAAGEESLRHPPTMPPVVAEHY